MDLEIKDVAELLGVSITTVRRWLNEGKIPSYRLNHQYRFSRNEIEDWVMQQKMASNPQSTLTPHPHKAVDQNNEGSSRQFSLYRALHRGDVILPSCDMSKEALIESSMQHMGNQYDLDPDVLTELFLDRERLMPTSLGHGIAVPHTRDFLLPTHFDVVLLVFPPKPMEYDAIDGDPVHSLFFLFACEDRRHLHLLAKIAHFCSQPSARLFLQEKPSKERVLEYVKQWEGSLRG